MIDAYKQAGGNRVIKGVFLLVCASVLIHGCANDSNAPAVTRPQNVQIMQHKRQVMYRVAAMGTGETGTIGTAIGINGQAIGLADHDGLRTPFIYQAGKMQVLAAIPGYSEARPVAVNAAGDIAVTARKIDRHGGDQPYAFLLRNNTYRPLFTDVHRSTAAAINSTGAIVGTIVDEPSNRRAFLWQDGRTTMIGTLNSDYTTANDINNLGQVVGDSAVKGSALHGFAWLKGHMRDLGTLGGPSSEADGINDQGQIVGGADASDGHFHAVLWEHGKTIDLNTPGLGLCMARKISNKGVVVGHWLPEGADIYKMQAMVWLNRKMYYLNDLIPDGTGWVLQYADGVNDRGEIVGTGTLNGIDRAFILTPVTSDKNQTKLPNSSGL
jgi:probable HAF family extracellular repeat protein